MSILPVKSEQASHSNVKDRVAEKQQKMKVYTDKRCGAKPHTFRVGDVVRVRIPFHTSKEKSRFSDPAEIIHVQGNCVTLSDNRKWNVSKLVRCIVRDDDEQILNDPVNQPVLDQAGLDPVQIPTPPPRMTGRERKAPLWMKDYVRN